MQPTFPVRDTLVRRADPAHASNKPLWTLENLGITKLTHNTLVACPSASMFLSSPPPPLSPRADHLFAHALSRVDDTRVAADHMCGHVALSPQLMHFLQSAPSSLRYRGLCRLIR